MVPAKNTPDWREMCPTWERNCWVRAATFSADGLDDRLVQEWIVHATGLASSASWDLVNHRCNIAGSTVTERFNFIGGRF